MKQRILIGSLIAATLALGLFLASGNSVKLGRYEFNPFTNNLDKTGTSTSSGGSGTSTPPGGPTNSVQFSNGSTFGGVAGFTFNSSTTQLSVTNITSTNITSTKICFTGDNCRTTWPTASGGSGTTTLTNSLVGFGASDDTVTGTQNFRFTTSSQTLAVPNITSTSITSTNLAVTGVFNFLGTVITNVSTWFNGLVDAYLTGGTGITYSGGGISFDCSEVEGTNIDCSGENITLASVLTALTSIDVGTVSSTSVTTTNLAVTGALSLPNNSVTDPMVVPGLTISGGTIDNSPIGAGTPSTAVFTDSTSTNQFATNLSFTNATGTSVSTTNIYIAGKLTQIGLVDCSNAITSKLIYTLATGLVSCGTDQTGGGGTTLTQNQIAWGDPSNSVTSSPLFTFSTSTGLRVSATSTLSTTTIGSSNGLLPNSPFNIGGNVNSYLQANLQNMSTGTSASGDWIVTADDGTDTKWFIDMGINNSGFADPTFDIGAAHDGYLYAHGGNLLLGTASSSASLIKFFLGNTVSTSLEMTLSNTGLLMAANNGITTTNFFTTNGVMTNATSTNHFITNEVTTRATSTDFFATRAVFTSGTSTNWFSSLLQYTNLNGTNATTTNFSWTNANGTSITSTNIFGTRGNFTGVTTTKLTVVTNLSLPSNSISNTFLRQSAGLSVIGRSANTTGNVADITGTNGQALRVSGTTLGFGALTLSNTASVTGTLPTSMGGTGVTSSMPQMYTRLYTPSSSSFTWLKPTSTKFRRIEAFGCAGGGGGGGAGTTSTIGAGGGGGGCFYEELDASELSATSSVVVTIGAKGAGAVAGNNSGSTGGTTSFSTFATCSGGVGGVPGNAGESQTNGGTCSGGDQNITGGRGMQNGAYADFYRGWGGSACNNIGYPAAWGDSGGVQNMLIGSNWWCPNAGKGGVRGAEWSTGTNYVGSIGFDCGGGGAGGGKNVIGNVAGGDGGRGCLTIIEYYE